MKEGIHPNSREVCFVDLSNEAILDNLARLNTDPRGRMGGRNDRWLADVKF